VITTGSISYGRACLCAVSVLAIACSGDTPTSPSDSSATTTTATIAEPSVTEDFSGILSVGGSSFYSFTVGANGTVNVTLASISGTGVPPGVWVELGVGSPAGEGCAVTSTVNGPAGASPQISTIYAPSVYCVRIRDLGNLFAPARFAIAIAHP
jgi:hypothetical protein